MTTQKAPKPTVDLDTTRERLEKAGLSQAAECLDGLISDAVKAACRRIDSWINCSRGSSASGRSGEFAPP
jgi:hypothetical protein